MKKLSTLAVLFLCVLATQAQYFEHLYGRPMDEVLGDGKNTTNTVGHILVGQGTGFSLPMAQISVTHTDITGFPIFNHEYEIYNTAGDAVYTNTPKVFEFPNGSGDFGIVGMLSDPPFTTSPPTTGVFYFTVDASGNPLNVYEYRINPTGSTFEVIDVAAVALSSSGNEAYITGTAQVSFTEAYTFIIKIDINSGGLIWSWVYDVSNSANQNRDMAADIIESPYSSDVVIVGHTYETGLSEDAYLFTVDAGSGSVTGTVQLYGGGSSWDYFSSIEIANQVGGFIIGGYTAPSSSSPYDSWMMLVDPAGVPFWDYTYDYSQIPGTDDRCYDVIERLNTSGQYEYYGAGTAYVGVFGTSDALVIKVDANGNGVGEYTYGDANFQNCYKIDQMNGTAADGLSLFGAGDFSLAPISPSDLFLIKTYFNGETPCHFSSSTPNPVPSPAYANPNPTAVQLTDFFDNVLTMNYGKISDKQQCYSRSLISGSNASIAPNEPKGDKQAIISPNPMQQGATQAIVELSAETVTTVSINIYDMLGRNYYTGEHTLVKGSNHLPIDISNTNMAAGMYTVKVTSTNISKNILLMVK